MRAPPRKREEKGLFREVLRYINELRDYVQEISPSHGKGIRMTRTSNGTVFAVQETTVAAEPATPGVVTMYRVVSVSDDTIIAKKFDGTNTSGDNVVIAKPFNLRRTGWHGVSVTYNISSLEPYPSAPATRIVTYSHLSATCRSASVASGNATGIEYQVIIPRYVPNRSVIYASSTDNGTGVSGADLVDLNVDGRAWARVI